MSRHNYSYSNISRKSKLIHLLGNLSKTPEHELLTDMMDYYDVTNLAVITEDQIDSFILERGLPSSVE